MRASSGTSSACPVVSGRDYRAPAAAPDWITPELIQRTIDVWQPYYEDTLTTEDAITILRNVDRLLCVLARR